MIPPQVIFHLQPARVYLEDTFVYYIKTLFHTYIPDTAAAESRRRSGALGLTPVVPEQVHVMTSCSYLGSDEVVSAFPRIITAAAHSAQARHTRPPHKGSVWAKNW